MKCKKCGKAIRKKAWYSGDPDENYCSAQCAADDLEIYSVNEFNCAHCDALVAGTPYEDARGAIYCSMGCALAAHHIEEKTK